MHTFGSFLLLSLALGASLTAAEPPKFDYRLLATNRTSTMEKEMNEAADAGFAFSGVMGGETGFGGKEVVVVMIKALAESVQTAKKYKLLATSKTSTLQKEMQEAGDEGFEYKGQTVFESTFGGKEVSAIMERNTAVKAKRFSYRLLATSRTSTMQKELREAGEAGFRLLGVSVGKSAFAGSEVICVLGKEED